VLRSLGANEICSKTSLEGLISLHKTFSGLTISECKRDRTVEEIGLLVALSVLYCVSSFRLSELKNVVGRFKFCSLWGNKTKLDDYTYKRFPKIVGTGRSPESDVNLAPLFQEWTIANCGQFRLLRTG